MKTSLRACALVAWSILMLGLSGPGCERDLCEEQGVPKMDNRDRKRFPDIDQDWVCVVFYGHAIDLNQKFPDPPDVSGDHPADTGPKDPDGVVNAAIIMNSCFSGFGFFEPQINRSITEMYYEMLRDQTQQAMFERTACFKGKTNGCDAMRECIGVFEQVDGAPLQKDIGADPEAPQGCTNGTKYVQGGFYDSDDTYKVVDIWFNCAGLGRECYDDYRGEWCGSPRTACDPNVDTYLCLDDRPYACLDYLTGNYYYYQQPKCPDYGLACDTKLNFPWSDCVGTGAACDPPKIDQWISDAAVWHYETGVACESDTVMRACVGRGESTIDCSTLGQGFKCIPGDKPHCGFASECDRYTEVTCDGDSLVVCDGGRIRKVDCKSLGFTACDAKHAVCSPGIYDNLK